MTRGHVDDDDWRIGLDEMSVELAVGARQLRRHMEVLTDIMEGMERLSAFYKADNDDYDSEREGLRGWLNQDYPTPKSSAWMDAVESLRPILMQVITDPLPLPRSYSRRMIALIALAEINCKVDPAEIEEAESIGVDKPDSQSSESKAPTPNGGALHGAEKEEGAPA